MKRFRRKKEHIRPGAILPDTLRISNHITCSCMSSKEYNSRCLYLKKKCKEEKTCDAHNSWSNLKKISSNLKIILSQSSEITTDWEQEKTLHMGNYGYLNIAINFPEIWREIELIKNLINSFN